MKKVHCNNYKDIWKEGAIYVNLIYYDRIANLKASINIWMERFNLSLEKLIRIIS